MKGMGGSKDKLYFVTLPKTNPGNQFSEGVLPPSPAVAQ